MKGRISIEQLELTVEVATPKRKRRVVADTSAAAAARAATHTEALRDLALATIVDQARTMARGATADEVHALIAQHAGELHDVRRLMEVRRRVSDLHTRFKLIRDTGIRRVNDAGNPMIVWAPVDQEVGRGAR